MPGELAGESALCPQGAVPHSVETAEQTQVLPLSHCTVAAVVASQEGSVPVLLITLVVIRQAPSWMDAHTQHPAHGKGVDEL